jgi:magnesium transporter
MTTAIDPVAESTDESDISDIDPDLELYPYNEPEPGSPPGTLIIDEESGIPNIFVIDYTPQEATGKLLATPEECQPYLVSDAVSWIDVQGLGSEEVLQRLGKVFDLHPLMLEDVVNIPQRAKVEEYPDRLFLILHMVTPKPDGKGFRSEQVSFILTNRYLLTVQEEPEIDVFEPVRQRIHKNKGIIR